MIASNTWPPLASVTSEGLSIAVAGMAIVAFALTFISLFIASLPWVLSQVERLFPTPHEAVPSAASEASETDDEAVIAAIGCVLHAELQKQIGSSGPGSGG